MAAGAFWRPALVIPLPQKAAHPCGLFLFGPTPGLAGNAGG